jgi:hypothetical protein
LNSHGFLVAVIVAGAELSRPQVDDECVRSSVFGGHGQEKPPVSGDLNVCPSSGHQLHPDLIFRRRAIPGIDKCIRGGE